MTFLAFNVKRSEMKTEITDLGRINKLSIQKGFERKLETVRKVDRIKVVKKIYEEKEIRRERGGERGG